MSTPEIIVLWDWVGNLGTTLRFEGDTIGNHTVTSEAAIVLGNPDTNLMVVYSGTEEEVRSFAAGLYLNVTREQSKHQKGNL